MKKIYWILALLCISGAIILIAISHRDTPVPRIKIGVLVPLTGTLASYGEDIRDALLMAQKEINSPTNTLDLIIEDSGSDAKTALNGAKKLLEHDSVSAIIGGPGSTANIAIAPFLEEHHIPFIAISNASRLNAAGPYTFKALGDVEVEARSMAQRLKDQGLPHTAILYDTTSDSQTLGAKAFKETYEKEHGTIVSMDGYSSKETSEFRSVVAKIAEKKPQALYLLGNDRPSGTLIKNMSELHLVIPVKSWSALNSKQFLTQMTGVTLPLEITDINFSCDDSASSYCATYRATYSREPLVFGARAYDILLLISRKLKNTQSYDETRSAILVSLTRDILHTGTSGNFSFDAEGNIREREYVIRELKNGTFVKKDQN